MAEIFSGAITYWLEDAKPCIVGQVGKTLNVLCTNDVNIALWDTYWNCESIGPMSRRPRPLDIQYSMYNLVLFRVTQLKVMSWIFVKNDELLDV